MHIEKCITNLIYKMNVLLLLKKKMDYFNSFSIYTYREKYIEFNKIRRTLPCEARWVFSLFPSLYLFLHRGQGYPPLSSVPRRRAPRKVASLAVFSISTFCWSVCCSFSLRIVCRAICRFKSCALENARPYRAHVGKGQPFVRSFLGLGEERKRLSFPGSQSIAIYSVTISC